MGLREKVFAEPESLLDEGGEGTAFRSRLSLCAIEDVVRKSSGGLLCHMS
jgi:hypothetical protein